MKWAPPLVVAIRQNMGSLKKACLSIAAIAILAVAVAAKFGIRNEEPLCDGRRYALSTISNGASPYIGLSLSNGRQSSPPESHATSMPFLGRAQAHR